MDAAGPPSTTKRSGLLCFAKNMAETTNGKTESQTDSPTTDVVCSHITSARAFDPNSSGEINSAAFMRVELMPAFFKTVAIANKP